MVKCAITMLLVHSIMKKVSVYLTLFIYCSLTAQNINNISYEVSFLIFPSIIFISGQFKLDCRARCQIFHRLSCRSLNYFLYKIQQEFSF